MKQVWIVGQVDPADYRRWMFQGVFTTEHLAIRACRDANYFIAPADVDQELPHEERDWPGAYYPLAT